MIALAVKTRPTEEQIEKFAQANPKGNGIAWRETDKDGKVWVRWVKGIEESGFRVKDLIELAMKAPFPYVVHCRIPSNGPATPQLCHPFPIQPDAPLQLEGKTDGFVLFHNGTFPKWDDWLLDIALKGGHKIPGGKWSDSRAMAWMAAHLGVGFLNVLKEKIIAFGPTEVEIFGSDSDWKAIANGLWVSNLGWQNALGGHRPTHDDPLIRHDPDGNKTSKLIGPAKGETEGSPDQHPFCESSENAGRHGNGEECAQEGASRLRQAVLQEEKGPTPDVITDPVTGDLCALTKKGEAYLFCKTLNPKRKVSDILLPDDARDADFDEEPPDGVNPEVWRENRDRYGESDTRRTARLLAAAKGITYVGPLH